MAFGFYSTVSSGFNFVNPATMDMMKYITPEDSRRMSAHRLMWRFYEGYHFEGAEEDESPRVTENWCKKICNKFSSAELLKLVTFKFANEQAELNNLAFLDNVWQSSGGNKLKFNLAQSKSVCGDGWIHVVFEPKLIDGKRNPNLSDPFGEYPNGRISLYNVPDSLVYPTFKDGYDTSNEALESVTIMYPKSVDEIGSFGMGANKTKFIIVRYIYYPDRTEYWEGEDHIEDYPNPYGIIPIVHFPNISMTGKFFGYSDLVDVVPLNAELNFKNSDMSEILDYYSAPTTIVFGAHVSELERGVNKVWGGIPKDAKIENLELKGDMGAANNYRNEIKESMWAIGNMPKLALGIGDVPANMSSLTMGLAFMPMLDVLDIKKANTEPSLIWLNKLILSIGLQEGLIKDVSGLSKLDFYKHTPVYDNALPKDTVRELEMIQQEMKMQLTTQKLAMQRLGNTDNVEQTIKDIKEEVSNNPIIHGIVPVSIASGQELVRPDTGKVIVENPNASTTVREESITNDSPSSTSKPNNVVGTNKNGEDLKINSGEGNINPKNTQ